MIVTMISVSNNHVAKVVSLYSAEIDKLIKRSQERIQALVNSNTYKYDDQEYLTVVAQNVPDLVLGDNDKLAELINRFSEIISPCVMAGTGKAQLRNAIIDKLDYDHWRSVFLPKYFSALKIKACVYCNSMPTIAFEEHDGAVRARFQADHFYPKSDFPALCISLTNLYPVCGPCNNIKGTKQIEFQLYSANANDCKKSPYQFKLSRASLAKYIATRNSDNLEITFSEPEVSFPAFKLQTMFDIKGIYSTQKDLAEELILKARIYNKPYKEFLLKTFPKVLNTTNLSNRVLIGNYCEPEEIHNRPMAKFTQDIARQLKLI